VRVLLWHGWLLEGSGSNVAVARIAQVLRADGHDVLLLCQEGRPERYPWVDAAGTVDASGPSDLEPNPTVTRSAGGGRCVLLRPTIGRLLPVFVADEYEGFDVATFVELGDAALDRYLARNVEALRAAAGWHRSDVAIVGHVVPGSPIAARALAPGSYVVKVHGSDLEYAVRPQTRYRALATEGVSAARLVAGPSDDVLRRCEELVGGIPVPMRIVAPGVDIDVFRPRPRRQALFEAADRLDRDPEVARGRPAALDDAVAQALRDRDAQALDRLALRYDQRVPDPDAGARLRMLADRDRPLIGTFGKLIPQKGVQLVLSAVRRSHHVPDVLVVGFGAFREWLAALALALTTADTEALDWLRDRDVLPIETEGMAATAATVTFTGRLDHRYAPGSLAAMDVLVVPSTLDEAFGMVAVEGAAAGALPLVARHSGLAEIAKALEDEVGRPGLFSFQPGESAAGRLTDGVDGLLDLDPREREELGEAVSAFVGRTWSWRGTAERLLA
jgi:glycosyltransferase involved in cell wall biosynthesis